MPKHPGAIDKPGASWRVRMSVGGRRHTWMLDPKKYPRKQDAELFATERSLELRRRDGRGLPGPMPVSELLRRFKDSKVSQKAPNTRKTYASSFDAIETYLVKEGGDPRADAIRRGHVQGFLDWRRDRNPDGSHRPNPLRARSLAKDRAVMHALFAYGAALEVVQGNPVKL